MAEDAKILRLINQVTPMIYRPILRKRLRDIRKRSLARDLVTPDAFFKELGSQFPQDDAYKAFAVQLYAWYRDVRNEVKAKAIEDLKSGHFPF